MKTTFEQARRAADRISAKLGSPVWFLGVGIELDASEGFTLSVRVAPGYFDRVAPFEPRFDGVVVRALEREIAKPRR